MIRVLTLLDYYLPGFRSGGPATTLLNMTETLGDEVRFHILTSNHDLGETTPYEGITPGVWQPVGKTMTYYLTPAEWRPRALRAMIRSTGYDVLYLNSAFSPKSTLPVLLMRRLRLLPERPVVLAARGEFSAGALQLKSLKKRVFLTAARILGLYRDVLWQASSDLERDDILRVVGPSARVHVAPDCTSPVERPAPARGARPAKAPGTLRLVFLSRISPKKNLLGAIELLAGVEGAVTLDVYGPVEDRAYWARCEAAVAALPPHVSVRYVGPVSPEDVAGVFARYDAFLFPTLGENFGHVIFEALLAGCPVVTSDRTPWRGLAAREAGFDLGLESPEAFRESLRRLAAMDDATHDRWSRAARAYAQAVRNDPDVPQANLRMFHTALARKH